MSQLQRFKILSLLMQIRLWVTDKIHVVPGHGNKANRTWLETS